MFPDTRRRFPGTVHSFHLRICFQHEVERGLRGPAKPRKTSLTGHVPQLRLTGLRTERQPYFLCP